MDWDLLTGELVWLNYRKQWLQNQYYFGKIIHLNFTTLFVNGCLSGIWPPTLVRIHRAS